MNFFSFILIFFNITFILQRNIIIFVFFENIIFKLQNFSLIMSYFSHEFGSEDRLKIKLQ
ncbi:hypothetical protein Lepto782_08045 [Leptospira interrogans serovar Canicola]|uniref:Uncharacterized protein n=2 Tax=Leptospira interrogans TaxID=173 RepID=A0AAQ0AYE7_LEPIR|nr:hypothetical protein E4412_13360 [Leptospira interrogans]QOI33780.1 hypothetical protein LeptoLang_05825 [Leptospira interrogans serovar Icterohaemorrhagiae]QOI42218.1 hypothetical protein Lepto782_08045 [Leptospira interrogans serovar Canicola]QOI50012.1 hypothetical protein Lepto1489_05765 [Leptospira interrogans serovar Bataviae]QOI51127.1 hypothetical protein Lepto1489_12170 [Leptospira interrogans serovar Bataviae]